MTIYVPYFKPFYLGLESGIIRSNNLRRYGLIEVYGYKDNESAKFSNRYGLKNATYLGQSTNSYKLRGLDV